FLKATNYISWSGVPLLHEMIPMIDILTHKFKKCLKNSNILPVIYAAVAQGLAIINKYYSKTDKSIMWKTAMIMHSHYKLNYFHSQNWLIEWIKIAEDSVCEMWIKYYK
ncbi:hypothetical protein ARMGADRAFT_883386, partial [Armillaria gallica]